MTMRRRALLAAVFVASALGGLRAAGTVESGPQPGKKGEPTALPSSFQMLSVVPESTAGRFRSPVSDFGLNPAVLLFTRSDPSQLDKGDSLSGLLKTLDNLAAK